MDEKAIEIAIKKMKEEKLFAEISRLCKLIEAYERVLNKIETHKLLDNSSSLINIFVLDIVFSVDKIEADKLEVSTKAYFKTVIDTKILNLQTELNGYLSK
jgi:hypothetical protein